jgi:hypothetical protein
VPITPGLTWLVRRLTSLQWRARCVLLIASLAFLTCSWADAADNLIVNGNLTEGNGLSPEGWQSHQWHADGSIFSWQPGAGGGQLQIVSKEPNDAQWVQHLRLGPGWYHFSAQLRSHNVGLKNTGASLCLLQNWVSSQELHGDNDWQSVDFYVKEGAGGAEVDLACRLGGYGNLNTGEAECRAIQAVAVSAPAAGSGPQYDLAPASVASGPPQAVSNKAATLVLVSALLVLLAIGWRTRQLRAQKSMLLAERKAADRL